MEAKEYLRQYEHLTIKMKCIREELERAYENADTIKSVSDNDGLPHGTKISSPTEDKAIRIADLTRQLEDIYHDANIKRLEVFTIILKVTGIKQEVLKHRYCDLMRWEPICTTLHISWAQVHRIHKAALEDIEEILKDEIE